MDILDKEILAGLAAYSSPEDDLLQTLIDDYREAYPELLQNLRTAFKNGSTEDFSNSAHALKSSSGALGLKIVRQNCEILENTAALDENCERLLSGLEADIDRGLQALTVFKSSQA